MFAQVPTIGKWKELNLGISDSQTLCPSPPSYWQTACLLGIIFWKWLLNLKPHGIQIWTVLIIYNEENLSNIKDTLLTNHSASWDSYAKNISFNIKVNNKRRSSEDINLDI